jgi:hypothetical protein
MLAGTALTGVVIEASLIMSLGTLVTNRVTREKSDERTELALTPHGR